MGTLWEPVELVAFNCVDVLAREVACHCEEGVILLLPPLVAFDGFQLSEAWIMQGSIFNGQVHVGLNVLLGALGEPSFLKQGEQRVLEEHPLLVRPRWWQLAFVHTVDVLIINLALAR